MFIVLVASYDLLLGYTGIVSFAHTMFFGLGAYGVAHRAASIWAAAARRCWSAPWPGRWPPRVLALADRAAVAAGQGDLLCHGHAGRRLGRGGAGQPASGITGGEDGLNFQVPQGADRGGKVFQLCKLFGVALNGKLLDYYLVFACSLALFLVLLRIVNSPFGRVLLAIRENEFRAEAIGYRVVVYRTAASVLSAVVAALAGSLYAIWLRYAGPSTALGFEIMIDILLMVVIGGMGTMYGAVIGAAIFVLAQNYLQALMGLAAGALAGVPVLPLFLNPDRWLLWLGVLFILSVYFFPTGIVGRLRRR